MTITEILDDCGPPRPSVGDYIDQVCKLENHWRCYLDYCAVGRDGPSSVDPVCDATCQYLHRHGRLTCPVTAQLVDVSRNPDDYDTLSLWLRVTEVGPWSA